VSALRLGSLTVLILAAILLAACDLSIGSYRIANESNAIVLTQAPPLTCIEARDWMRRNDDSRLWQVVQPGETYDHLAVTFEDRSCVLVADASGRIIIEEPYAKDRLYTVRPNGNVTTSEYESTYSFSFDIPGWVFAVFAAPFLFGFVGASWITLRFFYRYYISKTSPHRPAPAV
jgi:hypothetical protein